jgi:hypothetical protein
MIPMKLIPVLLSVLFAFVLAACGGGGSSGPDPMNGGGNGGNGGGTGTPPVVTPVDFTPVTAGHRVADAGTYEIDAGDSMDAGYVTFTCPPGGEDCSVEVAEDGMSAESTGGMATAMNSEALNAKLAGIERAIREEAMRVAMAINHDYAAPDADSSTDNVVDPAVSIDSNNMIVFTGVDMDDDTDDEFSKSDMAPAMIPGWEGAKYERSDDEAKTADTIVKYNNKEPNTDALYIDHFGAAQTGIDGTQTNGVLTMATDQSMNSPIVADFGLTAHSQTITFDNTNTGDMTEGPTPSISGSVSGIPGTFTCAGTCTATSGSESADLMTLSSGWMFTPSAIIGEDGASLTGDDLTEALPEIMVEGVVPDPDFMIFGYWLHEMTDDEGATTYQMAGFQDGTIEYGGSGGNVADVDGTATYEGPATGLYMSKALTDEGQPTDPFNSGQFVADVMLQATFGQTDAMSLVPNTLFTISGMIDNFRDAEGDMINAQWGVSLEQTTIGGAGTTTGMGSGDGQANSYTGVANAMNLGMNVAGSYSGTFYGAAGTDNATPSSTAGMFDAHFSNGHVRGAFGATLQE